MHSEIQIEKKGSIEKNPLGQNNLENLKGLSSSEILERKRKYGDNILPVEKGPGIWTILFSQFKSPLVYIILFAALVSLIVGEYSDFGIIMAVVLIDAVLGFVQEYRAQKTYEALKTLVRPTTTVIRDGQRKEIEVSDLVPGDLVLLNSGEHVPGDGIIIQDTKLALDESILTGESEPINKSSHPNENLIFMGTIIVTGRGLMEVTKIGSNTELGQIATSLQYEPDEDTPLQIRLKSFSKVLTRIVIAFTTLILIAGVLMGKGFLDMLRVSIILAIAAVPEGLLIAVTIILVLGMRKILRRKGLVKKLLAVETLGSVTVVCTDKTGTVTEGRMKVTHVEFNDKEKGLFNMLLCNNLEGPVDIALWEYAQNQFSENVQHFLDNTERVNEELFTSETKYMITENMIGSQSYFFLKGAPEIILNMCRLAPEGQKQILSQVENWAGEGLRLIGLAYRQGGKLKEHNGFSWIGLVGMEDPIREGVGEAIKVARQAGIQIKLITGDYARTAEHIGRRIDLFHDGDQILEGEQLSRLNDAQLREEVNKTVIFARIRPQDKLRIMRALQANGEVTAMIGDGVNDAPALKRANIGVVVESATDVAKEIADIILLDNNFRTIVACIEEGRVIFENIRKVVAYTLSNSFAEVLTIFGAMLLKWPAPLTVAQILWIHLICDGPSDIVLGFEPKEPGIMKEKPKSLKEPILTRLGLSLIGVISVSSSMVALLLFGYFYNIHFDATEGRSIVFASFAVNSMVYIFAYRSLRHSLLKMPSLIDNKPLVLSVSAGLMIVLVAFIFTPLREILGIVPLTWQEWLLVAILAISLLNVVEIGKYFSKRLNFSH